jgi:uncharacterized protein (TIGR03032 family)
MREVRYAASPLFAKLLRQSGASLLVSTYQAGKVAVIGTNETGLTVALHNFERAMGVAVGRDRIAVGTAGQVWLLRASHGLARQVGDAGRHDGCFLTRSSHYTGEIQSHEMAWAGDDLWVVNTLFSCLCTFDEAHSFVPRWRPPFVSSLAPEDRCHLNGLALVGGLPKYVTAMAETDERQGWRPTKARSGCLIDVASGATVARGFAMPHSPRVHQGRVWLLDSGTGRLVTADPATGRAETVDTMPGFTRGLAFHGGLAFVGLSKVRETSTFGGVPVAQRREELKCGVAAVDLRSGRTVATFEFQAGVDEIFDVQVLPGVRNPALSGPHPTLDGGQPVWTVPPPPPAAASAAGRSDAG